MEKKIGIWMNKRTAKIITPDGNISIVESEVEEFNPKGGSRSKVKFGPQDVVQDDKYLEREKHQMRAYFNEVIENLPDADSIVVFGPAETGRRFVDHLEKYEKGLHEKIAGVERSDKMTDNQLKAWVKDYF